MKKTLIQTQVMYWTVLCVSVLSACSTSDARIVQGPLGAPPIQRPTNIERINDGSIFQPNMNSVSLFTDERKPRFVGDTLKVEVAETLTAKNTVDTNTSKATTLANQGPGSKAGLGLISSIMNLNANASGSSTLKGTGSTDNSTTVTAEVAASVINVLPNGNLVVAGDRQIALNGSVSILRFSGIINPKDILPGNTVASANAINARFEVVGRGEVSDAAQRSWIQRVLADSLSFW